MRRLILLSLLPALAACGFDTWSNPPFGTGTNPHMPVVDSLNMSRVVGHDVAVSPLHPEPGDIWPGPLPPPQSLQDLERGGLMGGREKPVPGSPLSRDAAPLSAPVPGGGQPAGPGDAQSPSQGQGQRIIVPNGNGTSTVIYPDGRIETIPTPKE